MYTVTRERRCYTRTRCADTTAFYHFLIIYSNMAASSRSFLSLNHIAVIRIRPGIPTDLLGGSYCASRAPWPLPRPDRFPKRDSFQRDLSGKFFANSLTRNGTNGSPLAEFAHWFFDRKLMRANMWGVCLLQYCRWYGWVELLVSRARCDD